jgi:hypothetical protein
MWPVTIAAAPAGAIGADLATASPVASAVVP